MNARALRGALGALLIAVVLGAPLGAGAAAVCTWGGTPDGQTGVFALDPGLSNTPSPTDLAFTATGALDGDDARCTGTMTFEGKLFEGASCRFFLNAGTVSGVPGLASYIDSGAAYSHGSLYAPNHSTAPVATFNALVVPSQQTAQACASAQGLSTGAFSSAVVWF